MVIKCFKVAFFGIFLLSAPVATAQNKSSPQRIQLGTLEDFVDNEKITVSEWYSITDANPSYKIRYYDIYEQYRSSFVSNNVRAEIYPYPVQFVKVGDKYLPHIILQYVRFRSEPVNIAFNPSIKRSLATLKTLEAIYLSADGKNRLANNDINNMYNYIKVKKDFDGKIEAVRRSNFLNIARVFSYYPDGTLKTETVYSWGYDAQIDKNITRLAVATHTFAQEGKRQLIDHSRIFLKSPQQIENNTIKKLFLNNNKILKAISKTTAAG